jgi:hypothetical protein
MLNRIDFGADLQVGLSSSLFKLQLRSNCHADRQVSCNFIQKLLPTEWFFTFNGSHIACLGSFNAFFNFEFNSLAFSQRVKTTTLDG